MSHWKRVKDNGLRLAELTGANKTVVELFALFHDSQRLNEGKDLRHGQRGAQFAQTLNGSRFVPVLRSSTRVFCIIVDGPKPRLVNHDFVPPVELQATVN